MLNQFSRTQLLLGKDNMDRLAEAKVGSAESAVMWQRRSQEAVLVPLFW